MTSNSVSKYDLGLVASQAVLLVLLYWGDIGFDLPGRFGLSFVHGVFFAVVYVIVCAYCTYRWAQDRRKVLLVVQTMLFVTAILAVVLPMVT